MGTLFNRRRYMGGALPYDAEIEYLESTGTQYIDTNIISQNNLVYDFYLIETTSNNQRRFFGFKEGDIWFSAGMNDCNWGSSWFYVDFASEENAISNFRYDNRMNGGTYHLDFTDGNAKFTYNNTSKWTSTKTGTYNGSKHVHIFEMDYDTNPLSGRGIGRIRYFQIRKNNVLLFDGIPVRVGQTGYMYDRVSGTFFGNAGSGAFTLGPDLLTHYDAEVEYIQSSGTQYINTEIQGGSNAEYSLDFQILSGYYRQYAQLCASTKTPVAPKIYCNTSSEWRAQWQSSSTTILNSINQYDRHVIEFKGGILYMDSSQISNIGQRGFGNKNFCICGYTEENLPCYAKIFGLQIWIDGVLLRKYKPVRVGQSGYLYDEVSGRLFGDANGGTFGVGNDKTT